MLGFSARSVFALRVASGKLAGDFNRLVIDMVRGIEPSIDVEVLPGLIRPSLVPSGLGHIDMLYVAGVIDTIGSIFSKG
ncbi:MAG TPA: hypothetical protein VMA30_10970 [Xanthobacteraceae bacterium]|nr:hypothetical protein [Xanthobacteraceae bacterium]